MKEMIDIQVELDKKTAIVSVAGEVDLYSSRKARKVLMDLAAKKTPSLIIDLGKVPYMDSSGLATLVEGLQRVESYNGKFILCGLQPMVSKVFQLSRLNTVFHITESLDEAKSELNQKR